MKEDRLYLFHILECVDRIQRYCIDGREVFLSQDIIQDAVLRNLQTLAESTQRLSVDLKQKYPDVDWRAVSGFRNVLVHDYPGINLDRIWEIVSVDLPLLREHVTAIWQSIGPEQ